MLLWPYSIAVVLVLPCSCCCCVIAMAIASVSMLVLVLLLPCASVLDAILASYSSVFIYVALA
jgi:hypothetical protein